MATASVFVYGTLQRGECRADQWPHAPLLIQTARVRGHLFDLGPYPALVDGADWVLGERWDFDPQAVAETLRVLDAIEGYSKADDDLYKRCLVMCHADDGQRTQAYTYLYARTDRLRQSARRVLPDDRGLCHWKGDARSRLMRPP